MKEESAKTALFRELDKVVASPQAILVSNTSSIPIMRLGVVTGRPEKVLGIHFFNPVPVLSLVELVPSLLTSEETTERARAFIQGALGKQAIDSQDRAGFVVNALMIPFVLSAIRMLESGFATAQDIDRGLVLGAAHPQGLLALADLIGLDTTKAVAESRYKGFKGTAAPLRHCWRGWSTLTCWVARPAAASTRTSDRCAWTCGRGPPCCVTMCSTDALTLNWSGDDEQGQDRPRGRNSCPLGVRGSESPAGQGRVRPASSSDSS